MLEERLHLLHFAFCNIGFSVALSLPFEEENLVANTDRDTLNCTPIILLTERWLYSSQGSASMGEQ